MRVFFIDIEVGDGDTSGNGSQDVDSGQSVSKVVEIRSEIEGTAHEHTHRGDLVLQISDGDHVEIGVLNGAKSGGIETVLEGASVAGLTSSARFLDFLSELRCVKSGRWL